MSFKPVIVAVAYRRLEPLKRLLRSVEEAEYSDNDVTLIISIDHHPENSDVVEFANSFEWTHGNKIVKTHEANLGLRKHIIECGDHALEYGSVIILEDDELVAPMFYEYARAAFEKYEGDNRIAGVSLYSYEWNGYAGRKFQPFRTDYDVFFAQFSCTWGQAWSKEQWSSFKKWYEENHEIKVDDRLPRPVYDWNRSWGKFFFRFIVENDRYYVMPYNGYSTVFGEEGTHAAKRELMFQTALNYSKKPVSFPLFDDGMHYDAFYESVELRKDIAAKYDCNEDEVAVDIYGLKGRTFEGKGLVLSSSKLDKKILDSYDLNLRPQEQNVRLGLKGEAIFLYDMKTDEKNKRYDARYRNEYDLCDVHESDALRYTWDHFWTVIKRIIKK